MISRSVLGPILPGAALFVLSVLQACGDDDDAAPAQPAEAGSTGSGGSAGTGGARSSGGTQNSGGAGGPAMSSGGGAQRDASADVEPPDPPPEAGSTDSGGADARAPARARWLAFTLQGLDTQPLYLASTVEGQGPIRVSPNLSGFTPPTWRADGKQLLYVDYFCCGASNAAWVVDIDARGLAGSPRAIHQALAGGRTIRDADYSPDGRWLLAQFVDETNAARWSLRRADEGIDTWTPITPGAPWGATRRGPVWAPSGQLGVLIEGSGISEPQRVYVLDFTKETPGASLVRELPAGQGGVTEVLWQPEGAGFVLVTDGELLWAHGESERMTVDPVTSGPQVSSQGVTFSADGTSLLYSAADGTGNAGLYSRAVSGTGVGSETVWFAPPGSHVASVQQLGWGGSERVLFIGDAETDDRFELYERNGSGPLHKLSAPLADGAAVSGFAVLGPRVAYAAQEADGATQNVLWVHPEPQAVEPITRFAAGSSGWAGVAWPPRGTLAFLSAMEVDAASGNVIKSQLSLLDGESGAARIAVGPLPDGAYVTNPYAWSSDSRWFAYVADADADSIPEAWVLPMEGGSAGTPRVIANLFDAPGGAPAVFVWQP